VSTNVSEQHIASIFRAEKKAEQKNSVKAGGKRIAFRKNINSTP
jgi:hypothetical protein